MNGDIQKAAGKIGLPFFRTAKSTLLVAFSLIVGLNVLIGSIGWSGFSDTEQALNSLREQSLPDIGKAMQLARRSSAVAAIAPFVSSIQVMNKLNVESEKLEEQLLDLKTLVNAVEPPGNRLQKPLPGSLQDLSNRLETNLQDLIQNTREGLGIRSDMLELRYALDGRARIEARLRQNGESSQSADHIATFGSLVGVILTAAGSENSMTITSLEAQFSGFSKKLEASADSAQATDQSYAELREFIATQAQIFDLRRHQLSTLQKTQYLLSSIHALSIELGDRVSGVVAQTTEMAQARSAETSFTLERGKSRILPLTLMSVIVGAAAAFFVLRNLAGSLQAVTMAMTRLASGDRTTSVPAMDRVDEVGSLARAFNIFKEQSFDREMLANDLISKSRTLEATFTNMTDGLSVFDSAGHLIAWNPQFIEINELDTHSVTQGMHFHEISEQLIAAGVAAAFLDGQIADPEKLYHRRQTAAVRYEQTFRSGRVVELRSRPMEGGFATIYTDLTERRTIERQLRQAQRMEAVGQLTSGMAHDFNNLLAAVSGNLQLLHEALQERPDLTPRILRALDAADRGATLTQRLLAFSRLQTLQPQMTNLNDMIRNLVDLLDYSIGNGIVIETDLQPTVDEVFVDQGQLENAVFNLIFNSRDAMPEGGKIVISVAAANVDDGFVRINVKDDGFGMTPDVVARVYEPFFTTKEKGKGSGLGLSMVYGFVSQSGGQVDIASEPNGGTTVSIKLPKAKVGGPTQPRLTPAVANDTVVGGSECILIVEDDRIVRETAVDMLTSLGYRAVVAESLEHAQVELAGATFDLLFTDYILPDGMTGDDVAAHARRTWPEIVVLYTSGYPSDKLNRDMMRASDIRLLAKPYRRETLAAVIRQLLDVRQSKPKRSTATLKR